jgi:hypothetical protein
MFGFDLKSVLVGAVIGHFFLGGLIAWLQSMFGG